MAREIKEKHIKIRDFLFLHCVLVLYTFGGIMSKNASSFKFLSFGFCFFYGAMLIISFVYAFLWQQVLKKMPLVVAYANKAVTIIWGLVCGYLFFEENITILNIIGVFIIIVGVYIVVLEE